MWKTNKTMHLYALMFVSSTHPLLKSLIDKALDFAKNTPQSQNFCTMTKQHGETKQKLKF